MMESACVKCTARCCQYFAFEIDEPDDYEQFEHVRWYLLHKGISVHVDEGRWFIAIENPCKALGADNRCTIYEHRPVICRQYDTDGCDAVEGGYDFEQFFETPESIEAYARKKLGESAFERARAKVEGRAAKAPRTVPLRKGRRDD